MMHRNELAFKDGRVHILNAVSELDRHSMFIFRWLFVATRGPRWIATTEVHQEKSQPARVSKLIHRLERAYKTYLV